MDRAGTKRTLGVALLASGVLMLELGGLFWGGVFAQKNAVQQSTKLALDEILRQLITDLNTQAR